MSDNNNTYAPPLVTAEQEEVFHNVRYIFRDLGLTYFDASIAPQLRKFISDSYATGIDSATTKKVEERYYEIENFNTKEEKKKLQQIRIVFRTASTLIISLYPENRAEMYVDVAQLLENYPQFAGQPHKELQYLLQFRNYMHTALKIIEADGNKALLLAIAARLEGSGKVYNTGGGQTSSTTRRVEIYKKEGGVQAKKHSNNSSSEASAVSSSSSSELLGMDDLLVSDTAGVVQRGIGFLLPSLLPPSPSQQSDPLVDNLMETMALNEIGPSLP